ncbi:hypothetical protein XENOCAPTIV_013561 [Xenoophorus captivus]|uniref:Uncharacterized protein n=1 Tax=Xenoophorus captivus TaxID=1517983 RepID=A0ABV0QDC5_9TELE
MVMKRSIKPCYQGTRTSLLIRTFRIQSVFWFWDHGATTLHVLALFRTTNGMSLFGSHEEVLRAQLLSSSHISAQTKTCIEGAPIRCGGEQQQRHDCAATEMDSAPLRLSCESSVPGSNIPE